MAHFITRQNSLGIAAYTLWSSITYWKLLTERDNFKPNRLTAAIFLYLYFFYSCWDSRHHSLHRLRAKPASFRLSIMWSVFVELLFKFPRHLCRRGEGAWLTLVKKTCSPHVSVFSTFIISNS